ncbi:hypothetical protein VCHA53O466_40053 [Vibrio chagasii]|nr:hypothetical protein VCHA53O466_40053 [Vibrio chagasii]
MNNFIKHDIDMNTERHNGETVCIHMFDKTVKTIL